jgi:hypothetical protein
MSSRAPTQTEVRSACLRDVTAANHSVKAKQLYGTLAGSPVRNRRALALPRELGLSTFSPTLRLDVAALTEPTFVAE